MIELAKGLLATEDVTDLYEVKEAFRRFCEIAKILEIDDISSVLQELPEVSKGPIIVYEIIQKVWYDGEISFNFKDLEEHKFSVSMTNSATLTDLKAPLIYFGDEEIEHITSLYEIVPDKEKSLKLNLIMKDYRGYRRIRTMYPRYTGTEYTEVRMNIDGFAFVVSCKFKIIAELSENDVEQIKRFLLSYEGSELPEDICKSLKKEIDFLEKISTMTVTTKDLTK